MNYINIYIKTPSYGRLTASRLSIRGYSDYFSHANKNIAEAITTPVIYGELAEEAQDDANFHLALQQDNPSIPTGLMD